RRRVVALSIQRERCSDSLIGTVHLALSDAISLVIASRLKYMKLSVVTPTFNEADNILQFLSELRQHLGQCDYEIIVVDDDSPDLTWKVAAAETVAGDRHVRVLRRTGRRGLGNSVIDGFKYSVGDTLACIDADLQHDPAIIPHMLAALERGADMVVASRYVEGGGTGGWGLVRLAGSKFATWLAKLMLGIRIHDPM